MSIRIYRSADRQSTYVELPRFRFSRFKDNWKKCNISIVLSLSIVRQKSHLFTYTYTRPVVVIIFRFKSILLQPRGGVWSILRGGIGWQRPNHRYNSTLGFLSRILYWLQPILLPQRLLGWPFQNGERFLRGNFRFVLFLRTTINGIIIAE